MNEQEFFNQFNYEEVRMSFTNEQRVLNAALSAGCPKALALIIVAQSKHESGNYTSNAFKTCNNLFGYKYVGQRGATQGIKSSEGDHYAKYAMLEDSVREIVAWIKRRIAEKKMPAIENITDREQYAKLLKLCGYYGAPEKEYIAGLNRFYKADIA